MKRILKALEELHKARPETEFWSVRFFSDGSGDLLDDKEKYVGSFGKMSVAVRVIRAQIHRGSNA